MNQYLINRRRFLKKSTIAAVVLAAATNFGPSAFARGSGGVSIIVDPADNLVGSSSKFTASIPGSYTDTVFPLQYYFGLNKGNNSRVIFPGFDQTLANQPYYHVRSVKG